MSDRTYELTILALTENGVRCSAAEGEAFWLPKGQVKWHLLLVAFPLAFTP
jgi:hypothetical protein